jgi:ribonuclease HI
MVQRKTKTMKGGIGVYIKTDTGHKIISKGFQPTKTGRMEVTAMLYAIRHIPKKINTKVTIYSDSQYVVNTLTKGWLITWKASNFGGKKNVDLWKLIINELDCRPNMKLSIKWTKGHQEGDCEITRGNNIADQLANYKNFDTYEKDL